MNNLEELQGRLAEVKASVSQVVMGQEAVIDLCLVAVLTKSHALLEGVPGVAKTLMVRTLASVLDAPFNRIQFTPDLMPSDITGVNVFNAKENEFTLVKGPLFTSFLLADEINRAPAKTQSALLQAMQERLVTIDRETYVLDERFTVFATQNPVEFEGTYPLPEAQMDRFMLKIVVDYPSAENELRLAEATLSVDSPESILASGAISPLIGAQEWSTLTQAVHEVVVKEELVQYVVNLVRMTRSYDSVLVGAGPRATQSLLLAARAYALLQGRSYVTPDDLRALSIPVLGHRLVLRPEFAMEGLDIAEVVENIWQEVELPR